MAAKDGGLVARRGWLDFMRSTERTSPAQNCIGYSKMTVQKRRAQRSAREELNCESSAEEIHSTERWFSRLLNLDSCHLSSVCSVHGQFFCLQKHQPVFRGNYRSITER